MRNCHILELSASPLGQAPSKIPRDYKKALATAPETSRGTPVKKQSCRPTDFFRLFRPPTRPETLESCKAPKKKTNPPAPAQCPVRICLVRRHFCPPVLAVFWPIFRPISAPSRNENSWCGQFHTALPLESARTGPTGRCT